MGHQLKYTEWQSASGKWYCNDTADLSGVSGKWWVPARMLNMTLTDYILMLRNDYNANIIKYSESTDYLHFNWDKQVDCHKFVLFINREARNRKFMV